MSSTETVSQPVTTENKLGQTQTYANPAIPGFAPDPSIVLVDGIFYLVTSSFHLFPGLPIYASSDLQTWTQIGNAVTRTSQLDLSRATTHAFALDTGHTMVASGGLWAPTIRYHKGRFYIACTNCVRDDSADHFAYQNFYIYTDDIWSDSWSDPIYVEFHGIDPSLFFDDDDRVYFQAAWELTRKQQPSCTIMQQEIDIDTGKPLSKLTDIWQGAARYDTEGPHIYKKDGYYYLLVAEGGTFENHMLSIGRSRNVWGPYESYSGNPILTSKGKGVYIQNTGHGELFQDEQGAWWAVVLGARIGPDGRCPIGRETFLAPVSWPEGQWPSIAQPRMNFATNVRRLQPSEASLAKLSAASRNHRLGDMYIRNHSAEDYRFPTRSRTLLRPRRLGLSSPEDSPTFIGVRQRNIDFVAYVRLAIPKCHDQIGPRAGQAGLTIYKDTCRHIGIYYDFAAERILTTATYVDGSQKTVHESHEHVGDMRESTNVHLQIKGSERSYDLSFHTDEDSLWTQLASIDTLKMTARDFTGTIIGLHCNGTQGDGNDTWACFDDFQVLPAKTGPIVF